jgi:hypothetical protein
MSELRQRTANSWDFIIDLGRSPDGKRRRKHITVKGTREEAEAERAKIIQRVQAGDQTAMAQGPGFILATLANTWLGVTRAHYDPDVWEQYRRIIEDHIIPAIGHLKIEQLSLVVFQNYYCQKLENGRAGLERLSLKPKQLAMSTPLTLDELRVHHAVLRMAMREAVVEGILDENPLDRLEPAGGGRYKR